MLPPVAALSDIAFGQFSQPNDLARASRVQLGAPGDDTANRSLSASAAMASDRRDVLSLSGQLQLAQGLSSVAEAVGRVLKLPRHDGETLTDYADRLAETISALPPAERVAVQRLLMQMIKGVTLRLLVEVLKNPFGAEATRLSLQLEMDAAAERDPMARLVVTSYRQNDGSTLAALAGGAGAPTLAGEKPRSGSLAEGGRAAVAQLDGGGRASGPRAALTSKASATQDLPPTSQEGETPPRPEVGGRAQALAASIQDSSALAASSHPRMLIQASHEPANEPGRLDHAAGRGALAAKAAADGMRFRPIAAQDEDTYDGPSLARQGSQQSQRPTSIPGTAGAETLEPTIGRTSGRDLAAAAARLSGASAAETLAPSASHRFAAIFAGDSLGNALSFVASETALPGAEAKPEAIATLLPNLIGRPDAAQPSAPSPPSPPSPPSAAAGGQMVQAALQQVDQADAMTTAAIAGPAAADERAAAGRALAQEHSLGVAAGRSVSAPASNAAFVPPFIPYPVGSATRMKEHPLVPAVDSVDEDGQSGRKKRGRGQEGGQGRQEAAEGDAGDDRMDEAHEASSATAELETASPSAADPKVPVMAGAGRPAGKAEDFYRRLAAW
ncbi:hypothetical protein [Rhizobium sp. SSA_523]|uniref:hypothetical protein n=1 Tax=Rhizobium sp. SSA_523 TaxID=2952477 RepID=UPI0020904EF3|nr:hypothetical protein [Rhizobium sp. SSA_523]MCO5732885.1 hypothetical protein [Rhizobium sp. SSA_523]WKC23498.1 hypothetical protein QTJ18_22320 [Rhizobium sp. SSA_523]